MCSVLGTVSLKNAAIFFMQVLKWIFNEVVYEDVDWIQVAQYRLL